MNATLASLISVLVLAWPACAFEYPYPPFRESRMDPQTTGWPLTEEERAFVLKAEHERRPGRESNKHLPALWPVIPSAGFWGGTSWLDTHAKLVRYVQANPGPCDVLLVGDSITQQWGSPLDTGVLNEAWREHFADCRTINIGIGGDKSQNVLWRLDHGGVEGLQPEVVVVMIGNNNMFFVPETGVEAAAKGVEMVVANVRARFPEADVIAAKILPCHAPGVPFYEAIRKTNAVLDTLKLGSDPKVQVLDLWDDFAGADGALRKALFTPDSIHLSPAGYAVYAARLKPLIAKCLAGKRHGGAVIVPKEERSAPRERPVPPLPSPPAPAASSGEKPAAVEAVSLTDVMLKPAPLTADGKRLIYPYAPYNDGRMDPQLTGWPLTADETAWIAKGEYFRKPGHEAQKHLPELWPVTPSAARWGKDGEPDAWLARHTASIESGHH